MSDMKQTTAGIDTSVLADLRTQLEQERARLRQIHASLVTDEASYGPGDPMLAEPEDFGEMGQDTTAKDLDRALAENERVQLEQVEHALLRLDDGTYGLSEVTGKPIPLERLQALPWATTNVDDPHPDTTLR